MLLRVAPRSGRLGHNDIEFLPFMVRVRCGTVTMHRARFAQSANEVDLCYLSNRVNAKRTLWG